MTLSLLTAEAQAHACSLQLVTERLPLLAAARKWMAGAADLESW